MSTDSRHFPAEASTRPSKPERLFRAAIDAYCALLRPSRAEADRLDDLALPLIGSVSTQALRFAAAALSESHRAPASLVRKLANEPTHISAPLLMRSNVLSDIDLIALVGRHGLPHARIIAKRAKLNPDIRALIETLDLDGFAAPARKQEELPFPEQPGRLAETRDRLRSMMAAPAPVEAPSPATGATSTAAYLALRDAVLSARSEAFEVKLAELGAIDRKQAQAICHETDIAAKLGLLRFLGLSAEQMFLIMVCRQPLHASSGKAASALLKRYGAITYDWSKRFVLALRRESLPQPVNANLPRASLHQAHG